MTDTTIPKGVAKLQQEMQQPHVVLRRVKYRSRLPGERYIDPGSGELVTFEHLADNWRGYKDLRDGRHVRLATPEEIKAAGATTTITTAAATTAADKADKGGKS